VKRDEHGEPLRASVKLDRYAPRQIARHFRLTSKAREVLNIMTLDADWRSGCWMGTKNELAEDTLMSRNTIDGAVEELVAKGLIEILEPFRQGPGSRGIVLLLYYEAMVKLSKGQVESRNSALSYHDENAQQSRSTDHLRAADQEISDECGVRLRGKEGVEDSGNRKIEFCPSCDEPFGCDCEVVRCRLCDGPIDFGCDCEISDARRCWCGGPFAGHPMDDHEPAETVQESWAATAS
jgi:hypothetical protein